MCQAAAFRRAGDRGPAAGSEREATEGRGRPRPRRTFSSAVSARCRSRDVMLTRLCSKAATRFACNTREGLKSPRAWGEASLRGPLAHLPSQS